MPVILENTPAAIKGAIQEITNSARITATTADLINIYSTSVAAYSAANYRANSIAQVKFKVVNEDNIEIPETDPLYRAFNTNFDDVLRRSEITLCFWGKNLIEQQRNLLGKVAGFRWLNPNVWIPDVRADVGLRGFYIVPKRGQIPNDENYLRLKDAVFSHLIDFYDDFDGIAPAEVAFLYAGIDAEIAHTTLSFFQNMAIPAAIVQPAADSTILQPQEEEQNRIVDFLKRLAKGARNFGRTIVTTSRWEWQQLQTSFDQLGMPTLSEQARNAIFNTFHVPVELVFPSASGYAQALEARRAWIQMWLVPQSKWYASMFTEQVVKRVNPKLKVIPIFDDIPGMQEAIDVLTTNVINQVGATLLDLYNAQKRLGIEPDEMLKGIYKTDNGLLPRELVGREWNIDYVKEQLNNANAEGIGSEFGGLGSTPTEFGSGETGGEFAPENIGGIEGEATPEAGIEGETTTETVTPAATTPVAGASRDLKNTTLRAMKNVYVNEDVVKEIKNWRYVSERKNGLSFKTKYVSEDVALFGKLAIKLGKKDKQLFDDLLQMEKVYSNIKDKRFEKVRAFKTALWELSLAYLIDGGDTDEFKQLVIQDSLTLSKALKKTFSTKKEVVEEYDLKEILEQHFDYMERMTEYAEPMYKYLLEIDMKANRMFNAIKRASKEDKQTLKTFKAGDPECDVCNDNNGQTKTVEEWNRQDIYSGYCRGCKSGVECKAKLIKKE